MSHAEQRQRAHELLKSRSIHRALFAHPHSVTWLTGFAPPVETGPSLFTAMPPLVWYEDGHYTLYVVNAWGDAAAPFGQESDGEVVTYLGYTIEQPIDGAGNLLALIRERLQSARGKVGVEIQSAAGLLTALFTAEIVPVDGWLEPLRMVKTAEELTKLRENFALTDAGHAAARRAMAAGKREIDVWTEIEAAIQQKAGCRVPMGNDCVVGTRQPNNIGGWPLTYEIRQGDTLIVDLSTLLHGYWSDSCATYCAGKPSERRRAIHQVVSDALEFGTSLLRPGAVAKDIDQQIRGFIADAGYPVYPHHTGHGVGVSGHEAPRIVPYNEEKLEAGMVIMLEPGIYFPGETGVRLEDAFLITPGGAERLTTHDKSL